MRIVHIATEANPFFKTGGLGDVVGALSKAEVALGHEVFVIMPRFLQIKSKKEQYWISNIGFHFDNKFVGAGVYYENFEGVHYFFLENDEYFKRAQPYGENDDLERFGAFAQMAIETMIERNLDVEIVHLHDWQAAMVAPLIRRNYSWNHTFTNTKIVQTVHNLQFQGVGSPHLLTQFFQISHLESNVVETMTNFGNMNYLKAGLYYCDKITTVSNTYAKEILTAQYGESLEHDLQRLSFKLTGIINGIDDVDYDPNKFRIPFNSKTANTEKLKIKQKLQEKLNLEVDEKLPMYVAVTRLADQKGWDLLAYAAEYLATRNCQFVLLGTGDKNAENLLTSIQNRFPKNVCAYIGFDDDLARHIYSAGDFFLMPSKFEPCGIGQMLAMRFGSIPIVRSTGGLVDTVKPYNFKTQDGQGFRFDHYDNMGIEWAIQESFKLYTNQVEFIKLRTKNMNIDFSWDKAAGEYIKLYEEL